VEKRIRFKIQLVALQRNVVEVLLNRFRGTGRLPGRLLFPLALSSFFPIFPSLTVLIILVSFFIV
jgi:hypothetical protein